MKAGMEIREIPARLRNDMEGRTWLAALFSIVFFFLFPLRAAFLAGDISGAGSRAAGTALFLVRMRGVFSFENWETAAAMMAGAVAAAASGFACRRKVKEVPQGTAADYAVSLLGGFLLVAIPFAFFLLAGALITAFLGGGAWPVLGTAALSFLLHLPYFLLIYTGAVLCLQAAKGPACAALYFLIQNALVPSAAVLVRDLFQLFFKTFVSVSLGPVAEKLKLLSPAMAYGRAVGLAEWTREESARSGFPVSAFTVLMVLLAAAAFAAAGCFLYRRRESGPRVEAEAGEFRLVRNPASAMLTAAVIVFSLSLGLRFWTLRPSAGWALFAVLLGTFIAHGAVMALTRGGTGLKRFFVSPVRLAGCLAFSAGVFAVFSLDLFGFDTWIPERGEVKSASVYVDVLEDWVSLGAAVQSEGGYWGWEEPALAERRMKRMSASVIDPVLEIARAGTEALSEEISWSGSFVTPARYTFVTVGYTLKGGRRAYRQYLVEAAKIEPALDQLLHDKNYLRSAYPLMQKTGTDLAGAVYKEAGAVEALDSAAGEAGQSESGRLLELLTAWQQDFAELTVEKLKSEAPAGLLCFQTESQAAAAGWWMKQQESGFADYTLDGYPFEYYTAGDIVTAGFYPVFPSFARTCAVLQKYGIEPGKRWQEKKTDEIIITRYNEEMEASEITITDQKEIRGLKRLLIESDLLYYDSLFVSDELGGRSASVLLNRADGGQAFAVFAAGQVPEFVTERLDGGNEIFREED